jgi:tetratricopeptide (TPR) repeat protein
MTRLLVVLALLIPNLAYADDLLSARQHYEKGTALYDLQRYSEAAAEYEAAFEAKNDPALLFNIGQSYRFANEYAKSIRSFKAFLRRLPDAPGRAQVEAWVADMQRSLDAHASNETRPIVPTPVPLTSTPAPAPAVIAPTQSQELPARKGGRAKTIAGFTVAGVGVAALAVGVGFSVAAHGPYDELNHPSSGYVFNPSTQDALHRDQTLEATMLAVGGALVVGGVAVAVWGLHDERTARHASRQSMLAVGF